MTKFAQSLAATGSKVLQRRADIINADATAAQDELITALKAELRKISMQIANLEDLSVRSNDSLTPGEGFNSDAWVKEMQAVRLAKYDLEIELKIAEATKAEYFTDEAPKA